jgi:hypothetical protein
VSYHNDLAWQMYLAQRAHADYGRARMRALRNRLVSVLTHRAGCLRSFSKAQSTLAIRGHLDRGLREVPLSSIVGSVNRHRDFDANFNPTRTGIRSRWERLYAAALAGEAFPPVELYLIGDEYYVNDGNHRVSIARHQGLHSIEAFVTEYLVDPSPSAAPAPEPACTHSLGATQSA